MSFTSQFGTFDVSSLRELGTERRQPRLPPPHPPRATSAPPPHPAPQTAPPPQAPEPASGPSGDPAAIVAAIEALAGLHERGILSDEEFAAKKTDLLGRL